MPVIHVREVVKEYAYEKGSWDCTLEALKKSFHSSNCDGDLKVQSKSKRAEVQLRFISNQERTLTVFLACMNACHARTPFFGRVQKK